MPPNSEINRTLQYMIADNLVDAADPNVAKFQQSLAALQPLLPPTARRGPKMAQTEHRKGVPLRRFHNSGEILLTRKKRRRSPSPLRHAYSPREEKGPEPGLAAKAADIGALRAASRRADAETANALAEAIPNEFLSDAMDLVGGNPVFDRVVETGSKGEMTRMFISKLRMEGGRALQLASTIALQREMERKERFLADKAKSDADRAAREDAARRSKERRRLLVLMAVFGSLLALVWFNTGHLTTKVLVSHAENYWEMFATRFVSTFEVAGISPASSLSMDSIREWYLTSPVAGVYQYTLADLEMKTFAIPAVVSSAAPWYSSVGGFATAAKSAASGLASKALSSAVTIPGISHLIAFMGQILNIVIGLFLAIQTKMSALKVLGVSAGLTFMANQVLEHQALQGFLQYGRSIVLSVLAALSQSLAPHLGTQAVLSWLAGCLCLVTVGGMILTSLHWYGWTQWLVDKGLAVGAWGAAKVRRRKKARVSPPVRRPRSARFSPRPSPAQERLERRIRRLSPRSSPELERLERRARQLSPRRSTPERWAAVEALPSPPRHRPAPRSRRTPRSRSRRTPRSRSRSPRRRSRSRSRSWRSQRY